ncbi:dynein light chain 2, cytoplasmic-like isoform X2 [Anneissia japonica]|uniref:dynein light chain 2, cytoplasmic-like isoform X2 n=1 Tax=Anneissia japonica TaxID=1529436 RepID=UPI0014255281|nr:dynein light chain 2, cytoplasmic-like isoform X2 [Anneissia japonica]
MNASFGANQFHHYESRSLNDNEMDRPTAMIKSSDMTEEMQESAVEVAIEAFERCKIEKDIAAAIKRGFDEKHGPAWHCIVGKSFGSYVTHETDYSIYMYIGQMAVLLFKQG